jgi:hypothetical protein
MSEINVGGQWDELYDKEDDVYYVNFGTGEPSYSVEVDDVLVVEVGMFSNLPTGYRILNRSKIKTEHASHDEIKERLTKALNALNVPTMKDRQADVVRSFDKVLA